MKLTITTEDGEIYNLAIDNQMALEDLKALLEVECGVASEEQVLLFEGKEINELKKTMEEYNIKEHDIILMQRKVSPTSSK
ncbi:ubiquitin-related domain-containing protein [Cunninghamella echinulata]|nr:ubiquitin-related domain-containing protein [Cunninghamella echinulata]